MRECDRKNCKGVGTWMPKLELHVKGYAGAPAVAVFESLRVCDQCKATMKVSDLVDDSNWPDMVKNFTSRGYAAPTRKLTKIRWQRASDPESN